MELLPKAIEATLPPLYHTENMAQAEKLVLLHYFTPSWDWYVLEYDPEKQLFFGLVDGFEIELGYFGLDELRSIKGPLNLGIERDLHWQPKTLETIRAACNRMRNTGAYVPRPSPGVIVYK